MHAKKSTKLGSRLPLGGARRWNVAQNGRMDWTPGSLDPNDRASGQTLRSAVRADAHLSKSDSALSRLRIASRLTIAHGNRSTSGERMPLSSYDSQPGGDSRATRSDALRAAMAAEDTFIGSHDSVQTREPRDPPSPMLRAPPRTWCSVFRILDLGLVLPLLGVEMFWSAPWRPTSHPRNASDQFLDREGGTTMLGNIDASGRAHLRSGLRIGLTERRTHSGRMSWNIE